MCLIFGKHFDWHNSPAHLAFLATFLKPRSLDNHPIDNPWAEVLGEQPEEAVERFRKSSKDHSASRRILRNKPRPNSFPLLVPQVLAILAYAALNGNLLDTDKLTQRLYLRLFQA